MASTYRAGAPCRRRRGYFDVVCCGCGRSLQVLSTWPPGRGPGTADELVGHDPGSDLTPALVAHERRCPALDEPVRAPLR